MNQYNAIKQGEFDYKTKSWKFSNVITTGAANKFTFMNDYIRAKANGCTAMFETTEMYAAIMWVETKCGCADYKFASVHEAIL